MFKHEIFPNAPIAEALMDIRVQLPPNTDPQNLEKLHTKIKKKYTKIEKKYFFETKFEFKQNEQPSIESSPSRFQGFLFRSEKEKKLVQARIDGFTFNKLKPYENWDVFCSEGRKHWENYVKIANPLKVTRIALRYINRIEIPLPFENFDDFILINPKIAPELPQAIRHFFIRFEIPNPGINSTAIITHTIDKPTDQNRLPFIFDIDVIIESNYFVNEKKIWTDFEKLRDYKNEIFFKSITNKTKELFR